MYFSNKIADVISNQLIFWGGSFKTTANNKVQTNRHTIVSYIIVVVQHHIYNSIPVTYLVEAKATPVMHSCGHATDIYLFNGVAAVHKTYLTAALVISSTASHVAASFW